MNASGISMNCNGIATIYHAELEGYADYDHFIILCTDFTPYGIDEGYRYWTSSQRARASMTLADWTDTNLNIGLKRACVQAPSMP